MRHNIMVPYDGSSNAEDALRVAIDMAEKYDEMILLINVQPNFSTPHTRIFFTETDIVDYQNTLYKEAITPGLNILAESGVKFEAKMIIGAPIDEICKEAVTQHIRYIVMGSRGHSAIKRSVLGSVSHGILHMADCPVMVVPFK